MKQSPQEPAEIGKDLLTVLRYHDKTKHYINRYADSMGFMDWANQPDPFRRYEGTRLYPLAPPQEDLTPEYEAVLRGDAREPRPLDRDSLSEFFYYSLALSAWKKHQDESWALRVNPSSGNLHPTECYVLVPGLPGLADKPGVYHYAPKEHGLELRGEITAQGWVLPPGTFLAGLSSIHWRESWKYGERAYRYCQHDAGHALAALSLAAQANGWKVTVLDGWSDADVARMFGLDRQEDFTPEHRDVVDMALLIGAGEVSLPEKVAWRGTANRLSAGYAPWDIIEQVSEAALKREAPDMPASGRYSAASTPEPDILCTLKLGVLVRRRRSAQVLDGRTSLPRKTFFKMLSRTLPREGAPPFDCAVWAGFVHLGIFVHRVDDLPSGLYAFVRNEARLGFVKDNMYEKFLWERAAGAPEDLPLYFLMKGDTRVVSAEVSCGQRIASDGAFSLGMLAEFEGPLREFGPHFYRNLFWETGMIGQVLYLEAEAAGVTGTGIGCFFDDPVHQIFGIRDHALQSLYHFTVGGGLQDRRLQTLPAYAHLAK